MYRNCKILYYTEIVDRVIKLSESSPGSREIVGIIVRDYPGMEVKPKIVVESIAVEEERR